MKKIQTIFLFVSIIMLITVTNFFADSPTYGTAEVNGNYNEWDLTNDFFAHMYRAGNPNKDNLTDLYLRYNCDSKTLYALVLVHEGSEFPIIVENGDEDWIKINGTKFVSSDDGPPDATQPNFAWVDVSGGYAQGFEASFIIEDDNGDPLTYDIVAHVNVYDDSENPPSQTSETKDAILEIDCGALPVELSLFNVSIQNKLAQLNWETATEVNNYGFEVQRSSETNDWAKIGFVEGHGNSNSPKYYNFTDKDLFRSGNYSYRLKQIDIDGKYEYSDVVNVTMNIGNVEYKLDQNYPNPFNPTTTITYSIPKETHVDLIIYNVFGEEVARLVNDKQSAGDHSVIFNASGFASGIYLYTIKTDNYISTRKLLLLK